MNKSHSFSIYLLKEGFNSKEALRNDHKFVSKIKARILPVGAVLYVLDRQPIPPWWKEYFGIEKRLMQSLKGAIVFLSTENRNFAITFGHVLHNLKSESYEYDFGLQVTLNSVEPDKLKSLDSLRPENALRQRTQLSISSDLVMFDFDSDSTILKSLTGIAKDELSKFFKHPTGTSNIRISTHVNPSELPVLCDKLLELYKSKTYKTSFPDIQNVSSVKDPVVINTLNAKLIAAFRAKDEHLILTIPKIVNYSDQIYATFSGEGEQINFDDIFIEYYYRYLEKIKLDLSKIEIKTLKTHNLSFTNEDGQLRGERFNILKCLIFDTTNDCGAMSYHLCEGNWYYVDRDYVKELTKNLDPLCTDTTLPPYDHTDEAQYNVSSAAVSSKRLCLDGCLISPVKNQKFEPCDIFEIDNNCINLHHIKRYTGSASLSHLFNQGLNSIQILRENNNALEAFKKLVSKKEPKGQQEKFTKSFDSDTFKVIFQIITSKDKAEKSMNLPLFSRVSLRRTMKELRRMRIGSEFCFVKKHFVKSE